MMIRPGLTGVVGPNGCGKSNLLEALRWVMGETSYKAMRGGAMDDVIFSGTQLRPARNSAHVTLTIDNSKRTAPADFNDDDTLEITRIIERGQGSRYLVNGREVRAKDVKLLFEDAATGARSHALVRQGQIGEIVNAKPQARRRILEDAAGIAGLHTRRHDAELRLAAAEDNLTRLDDLTGQMSAQLSSLQRQARQAERYKELGQSLRQNQALALYLKWQSQVAFVAEAETNLQELLGAVRDLTGEEAAALNRREDLQNALQPARVKETKAAAGLARLAAAQDALAKEEELALERQKALHTQLEECKADLVRDEHLIEEGGEFTEKLSAEIQGLERRRGALTDLINEQKHAVDDLAKALNAEDDRFAALHERYSRRLARHEAVNNERDQLERRRVDLLERKDHLSQELASLDADGVMIEVKPLGEEIAALETRVTDLSSQQNTLLSALESAQDEADRLRAQKDETSLTLQALLTEIDVLEHLLEGTSQRVTLPVIDAFQADEGYETALWTALGDELDVPLEADKVDGLEGGGAAYWRVLAAAPAPAPLPSSIRPLADFVKGPDALLKRLSAIGVVEEEQGPLLQVELLPGQALVSLSGGLWRWDGFVRLPAPERRPPPRLTARSRLPSLISQRDELDERVRDLEHKLEAALDVCAQTSQSLEAARGQLTGHQVSLKELFQQQQELVEAQQQRGEEQARLSEALIHCSADLETVLVRLSALSQEDFDPADAASLADEVETAKTALQKLRDTHSNAQIEFAALSREDALILQRRDEIAEDIERWQTRSVEAKAHIEALKARIVTIETELKALADLPKEIMEKRQVLFSEIANAEQERAEAADQLVLAERAAAAHEKELRQCQSRLIERREDKARAETRLEGARSDLIALAAQIEKEFSVKPDQALQVAGIPQGDDLPSIMDVEADIERLMRDRDRLGAVNLRAVEEIQTLEAQHQSLTTERDDLCQAVNQLKRAVQQLNEEGRQRLLAAFDEVNGHFKRLFKTLFAGGEAQLQLVDSDDPLDAGLEIVARPPGKKPQVLTLLSGGEKALTAMSLIFAVFLTNPSPICVLDEVDAPLDDSNVDRFCNMMEEMGRATDTRFLVITHHPMTMERMDRLFGVTMSEKGVSQLVSVDLEAAEALRETA